MAFHSSRTALRSIPASSRGFSLIELMVTLSVFAILVAMAVPALQRFATSRATSSQAEELTAALRSARSNALKVNGTVSVCASSTTGTTPSCSGTTAWINGWLVFIDYNGDGALTADTDVLLRSQGPLRSIQTVETTKSAIVFLANGLSTSTASFAVKPSINTSDSGYASVARTVCVATIGRASLKTGVGGC